MRYKDSEHKLKHARRLFEDAVDHTTDAHDEAHRAERFYHNTECEGQWEAEDLEYLRQQQRPAFSFNMIKPKMDTFFGMYADAQRTPKVVGTGSEDGLLAKVINHVKDQLLQDANYEALAARQLKTGGIAGECSMHIEIEESRDGPDWIKVNLYRILPFELHWDIASIEPDRSDARYVFWDKWLSEDEFGFAYPDFKQDWKVMTNASDPYYGLENEGYDHAEILDTGWSQERDYRNSRWSRYYYDRQKDKVRVIRYEYKTYKDKYYLQSEDGQSTEIPKDRVEQAETAIALGAPMKVVKRKEEAVEVCEFIGHVLLEEYDTAGPFEGFSMVPFCYDVDEETGTAYGPIRNLFDPQMELNKSVSLEIEYLAQSTTPGVLAEEGAIGDEDAFSDNIRTPGAVATTKKNALVEGRVQSREASQPSAAVMARRDGAINLLSEISGMPSQSNLTAAEHAQAGVTVAIKHQKQKQTVSTPFSHFEASQTNVVEKIVQTITSGVMPEDQIAAILDKEEDFIVGNGAVVELMPNPDGQGQPVPKARANLVDMGKMKWRLDMEYTSENNTLRMLELDMFLQLHTAGVPIDPEVLVEHATGSKSTRERLTEFVEKTMQAQAEGSQAQSQALQQQTEQFAQIEMGKIQESQRHNMMTEQIDIQDKESKEKLEFMKIWEKADSSEKDRLLEMANFAAQLKQRENRVNG